MSISIDLWDEDIPPQNVMPRVPDHQANIMFFGKTNSFCHIGGFGRVYRISRLIANRTGARNLPRRQIHRWT